MRRCPAGATLELEERGVMVGWLFAHCGVQRAYIIPIREREV
jgi:hypothetical protein